MRTLTVVIDDGQRLFIPCSLAAAVHREDSVAKYMVRRVNGTVMFGGLHMMTSVMQRPRPSNVGL